MPQWARQLSVERWVQMASSAPVKNGGATPAPRRETCLRWLTAAALPAWSQRAIVDANGAPILQRYNECGETLVASIVAAVWGVGVSPDAYRAAVKGAAGSALTSAPDLVAMLAYGNVLGVARNNGASDVRRVVETATADNRGVLLLGEWPTPGGALHWLLATASAAGRLEYLNPWGGRRSWLAWNQALLLYRGQLVEVLAHYHVDCSRRALPW